MEVPPGTDSAQLFQDPEYWSGLGLEPSRTADWRSTNLANQAAVDSVYKNAKF